ncbi:hypothetical protein ABH931_000678 [Streptacidiphilus sp. MAP12-33]|uniref:hypothetical protein n=1 Tax=Streptacidiphilus sp. MAP12-33 TaxID=3156266 RepID=UPI0035185F9E
MNVNVPLVVLLGLAVLVIVKFLRLRAWIVVVLILFGFYLNHTMFGPAVDQTTKTGVSVVNNRH